jgi:hypothetical protein
MPLEHDAALCELVGLLRTRPLPHLVRRPSSERTLRINHRISERLKFFAEQII